MDNRAIVLKHCGAGQVETASVLFRTKGPGPLEPSSANHPSQHRLAGRRRLTLPWRESHGSNLQPAMCRSARVTPGSI